MFVVYDDDWRTRPLVWYNTYAEVEAAGYEVYGEVPKEED